MTNRVMTIDFTKNNEKMIITREDIFFGTRIYKVTDARYDRLVKALTGNEYKNYKLLVNTDDNGNSRWDIIR
jgi:hypothetical protein